MSVLLPDAQKREVLQFYFVKSLPYAIRILAATLFMVLGIVLQIMLAWPAALIGTGLFFFAGFLLAAAGYTNKPKEPPGGGIWKTVDVDRLDTILDIHSRSKSWDLAAFDVSNGLGVTLFLLVALIVGGLTLFGWRESQSWPFLIAGSAAGLYLPLWFSGLRAGYSREPLILKVRILRDLLVDFETIQHRGEEPRASLNLAGPQTDAIPLDAKFQINFTDASPDFYGLQCQININTVQGRKYPYCYFVVVAKRGMNIFPAATGLEHLGETTVETKFQGDVEIIVIRQYTTRTSGYHTSAARCRELLHTALQAARRVAKTHTR